MARLRAVLFDLDGTLIDTAPDFAAVLNRMLGDRGVSPLPFERVRETVSDGAGALVTLAFDAQPGDAAFEALRHELLTLYGRHLAVESRLFDGMAMLLERLEHHGLAWGLVTNKPAAYAEPLLEALTLHERCGVLVCPDHVTRRKPDPEALLLACDRLGCAPDETIYVGDHRRDIEAGRAAGMRTVACGYGYVHVSDPCSAWGADIVVADADELLTLIETHRLTGTA